MRYLLLLMLLASCSKTVVIESSTSWTGAVGGSTEAVAGARSVSGSGNGSFTANDATVCWAVQKTTRAGTLRVYLLEHSLIGADRVADAYTVAEYGVVAGCAP